jgi:hypothetical protein
MADKPKKRKRTLAEAAADATDGLPQCTRCGCRDWRVESTYQVAEGVRRRRVCRNCKQELIRTIEIVY